MSVTAGQPAVTTRQQHLWEAARAGDVAALQAALDAGAAIDAANGEGTTALHLAARAGHADAAAILLARGARLELADALGRTPLDAANVGLEALHAIRQRYHRMRQPRLALDGIADLATRRIAGQIESAGIIALRGFAGGPELQELKADFQRFVDSLNRRILRREAAHRAYDEEEHWWPNDRAYVCNNAFKYSSALVRLCCRPDLLEVVRAYVGIDPSVTRAVAMRYLPSEEKQSDMFGWHHDMEERRLKFQLLLSDVSPGDQHMSYVLGSHVPFHPLAMFYDNACPLEYCREKLGSVNLFDATGKAGDLFLFDSNGAHRGRRRPGGATRDAFFVEFSNDPSDLWGGDLPAHCLDDLGPAAQRLFARFLAAEKKWDRPMVRQAPAWIENLADVERWR